MTPPPSPQCGVTSFKQDVTVGGDGRGDRLVSVCDGELGGSQPPCEVGQVHPSGDVAPPPPPPRRAQSGSTLFHSSCGGGLPLSQGCRIKTLSLHNLPTPPPHPPRPPGGRIQVQGGCWGTEKPCALARSQLARAPQEAWLESKKVRRDLEFVLREYKRQQRSV